MANSNIINAVFGSGICVLTTSVFSASYGMKLRFSGIDLPSTFEVDFSNYDVPCKDSITMIGQNNEVQIPDDLWDSGLNIYAYVYLHPTDDSGVTVYTVTIPVLGRPNRTEETPTPHEQTVIEQAISALNDAVEQTAADVASADASASAAAQSEANAATSERSATASAGAALASQNAAESAAQGATESASGAAESAQNAANSASQAAQSATDAQEYAEQAEQSVQSITDDVERAERAANTATSKATEAASSAVAASTKAAQAEQSATAAAQSASSASTAAQNAASSAQSAESHANDAETAKQDAQDAQEAAETARDEAVAAVESVADKAAQIEQNTSDIAELVQRKAGALIDTVTGSIASFMPDATVPTVKGLTVNVEPIQDLHGYDAPWPAGGGKNKFNVDAIVQSGNITVSNGVISVTGQSVNSGKTLGQLATLTVGETYLLTATTTGNANYIYLMSAGNSWYFGTQRTITETDLNSNVRFYSGAVDTTAQISNMMIRLASVTDATFAPYSNECPISGWDSVEVVRTGKNLFGYSLPIHKGYWSLTSFVGDDSVVTLENATGWTNIRVPVPDGATITISGMQAQGGTYAAWLGSDNPGDVVSRFTNYSMNGTKTVPTGAKYLGICFSVLSTNYEQFPNPQIELGSTATAYEPYNGDTYTIQLGQTVYGCKIYATAGKMVVDRAIVDLGTLNWTYISNVPYFYTPGLVTVAKVDGQAICSAYKTDSKAFSPVTNNKGVFINRSNANVVLIDTDYTDANTLKASLSGVQLVYELATPITIDLSPLEISVLTGQTNNIWADSGDVSVEYAADLKTYINNKIAAAVAALS